jgi:hypothetical protein
MVGLLYSFRKSLERRPGLRMALLLCGVAALPLYVVMDIVIARRYEGYRYRDRTISELSAIDAPTRSLWMPPGFVYSGLTLAFGLGVWSTAGRRPRLRAVGILAALVGLIGFVGWPFAPMHKREVLATGGGTRTDTAHLALGGVNSLLFILSIIFGSATFGSRFRLYSIGTLLAMLIGGVATSVNAPRVSANEPTPWIGIFERVAVFSPMLWYATLAVGLMREHDGSNAPAPKRPEE